MKQSSTEASVFVIFGGTGDLSRRKLLPALCQLAAEGHIHERVRILAVGRSHKEDEAFRESAREAVGRAGLPTDQIAACVRRLH